MITSSLFFEKSFFTIQYIDDRPYQSELGPWGQVARYQTRQLSCLSHKNSNEQLSKDSLINNYGTKLKHKKSRGQLLKKLKKSDQAILRKYNKSEQIVKIPRSNQAISKKPKQKLFPSLNMNEFHELKAKGNSFNSYQTVDEILMKRKMKKQCMEQFRKPRHEKSVILPKLNKSVECKPMINGNLVCAIENPRFKVSKGNTNRQF